MNLKEETGLEPKIIQLMKNSPLLKDEIETFSIGEWRILSKIGLLEIVQERPEEASSYIMFLDTYRTQNGTIYNGSNFEQAMTYCLGVMEGTVEEIPVAIPEEVYLKAEQRVITKINAQTNITLALCIWLNVPTLPSNIQNGIISSGLSDTQFEIFAKVLNDSQVSSRLEGKINCPMLAEFDKRDIRGLLMSGALFLDDVFSIAEDVSNSLNSSSPWQFTRAYPYWMKDLLKTNFSSEQIAILNHLAFRHITHKKLYNAEDNWQSNMFIRTMISSCAKFSSFNNQDFENHCTQYLKNALKDVSGFGMPESLRAELEHAGSVVNEIDGQRKSFY